MGGQQVARNVWSGLPVPLRLSWLHGGAVDALERPVMDRLGFEDGRSESDNIGPRSSSGA